MEFTRVNKPGSKFTRVKWSDDPEFTRVNWSRDPKFTRVNLEPDPRRSQNSSCP